MWVLDPVTFRLVVAHRGLCLECTEPVYRKPGSRIVRHVCSRLDKVCRAGVDFKPEQRPLVICSLCKCHILSATDAVGVPEEGICLNCLKRLQAPITKSIVTVFCDCCRGPIRWVHLSENKRWPEYTGVRVGDAIIWGVWTFANQVVILLERGTIDLPGAFIIDQTTDFETCDDCRPPSPVEVKLPTPTARPFIQKYISRFGSRQGACIMCNYYGEVLQFPEHSYWPNRIQITAAGEVPKEICFCFDCIMPCSGCGWPVGLSAMRCPECNLIYD